ncbi:hypothetical protein [Pseudovibrio sp. Tun.PSC04-5.I4]|uniref:hypothetical protein n=1 Tax=Pseudovibrio sp. Tun.PSC04-5.I4 TaxID=1798213 RepID=UPI00088A5265|nr:hypothetical protein [Pseudovibrio sp. Tun.PSC04-5.I4]SDR01984.1 hypothetical protein SAMN04515695_2346 [Pseudovibrio sp. Tun.PSC04-5.I4]
MNCISCNGYGTTDHWGLSISSCERCNGKGSLDIEELDPKALKPAARVYWQLVRSNPEQAFEDLSNTEQINLAWDAAAVVLAYQSGAVKDAS